MHAGLPGGAGAPAGPLLLAGGLVVSAAVLAGDGSRYAHLAGVGSLALVVAGAALVLGLLGSVGLPRLSGAGKAFVALVTALVVWMGLSVLWSVAPDLSWNYFNRGLVYLSFVMLGLAIGAAVPRALPVTALGLAALSAAVVGWALAGKVIPDLFPDGGRLARLREPVDYWNALGLIAVIALLFGLWLASAREYDRWLRVGGTVLVFGATVALLLTLSRGSTATALVVVSAFVWLTQARVQALTALVLGAVPGIAAAAWAFTDDGLTGDTQAYDTRLEAGLQFGVLLVLAGGLAALAAWQLLGAEDSLAARVPPPTRRQAVGVAAGGLVALMLAAVLASGGDPVGLVDRAVEDFTSPAAAEETTGVGRLPELSSNSRWDWWRESWDIYEAHAFAGAGAGSFAVARRPIRRSAIDAKAPHSVPLQFLAEMGVVGFLLLVGAVTAAIAAAVGAARRGGAAVVLALVALAYLLHSLVDYDWDFVAITGPVFFVLGVLVAAERPIRTLRRPLLALAAGLAAVVAALSLVSPWAATRKTEDAYAALDRADVSAAADAAQTARWLNPLSLDPIRAEAAVAEAQGEGQRALELYVKAVELQPENWQSWYELAQFEQAAGLSEAALRHAGRAAQLDPKNPIIFELIRAITAPSS